MDRTQDSKEIITWICDGSDGFMELVRATQISWGWLATAEIKDKSIHVRMLHKYKRKVLLFQLSLFWMKESENFVQWSRLAAATQMEFVDHAAMSRCLGGSLWAICPAFVRIQLYQPLWCTWIAWDVWGLGICLTRVLGWDLMSGPAQWGRQLKWGRAREWLCHKRMVFSHHFVCSSESSTKCAQRPW